MGVALLASISLLAGKTTSFVKNSKRFAEMVSKEAVTEDEVLVSFDVELLFTNVPIGKALEVVNKKLTEDDTLSDRTTLLPNQVTSLLEICLRTTYFIYQGQCFEQTDGAAMGSPVSPVVANIFMEHVEEEASHPDVTTCGKILEKIC